MGCKAALGNEANSSAQNIAMAPLSSNSSSRIGIINGLRGLAIVWVVWHHLAYSQLGPGWHAVPLLGVKLPVFAFLTNGWLGVNLFFVLSGFVLMLPYAEGKRTMATRDDVNSFYKRRLQRLLPLYFISVFVAFLLARGLTDGKALMHLFVCLTGSFNFAKYTFYPKINPVLWSLGIEFWFSVIFPICVLAIWRYGPMRILLAVMALSLATRLVGTSFDVFYVTAPYVNVVKDSLAGRLDDFVVGMFLCICWVQKRRAWCPEILFWIGAALVLVVCCLWDMTAMGQIPRPISACYHLVLDAGFGCMIWALLSPQGVALSALFSNRPIQVIGMMCYSLYIWHYIAIAFMAGSWSPVRIGVYLVALFALSALSYRYIEFGHEKDWRKLFRKS